MTDDKLADALSPQVKKETLSETEHYILNVVRYDTERLHEDTYKIERKDSIKDDADWPDMTQNKTRDSLAVMTPVYHYHTVEAFKNYADIMMQAYREAVRLKEAIDKDMAKTGRSK